MLNIIFAKFFCLNIYSKNEFIFKYYFFSLLLDVFFAILINT